MSKLGNVSIVLRSESELKWKLKTLIILENMKTLNFFLLFFFHSECKQSSTDMFLSVLIWRYCLVRTQDWKLFAKNNNRPATIPVLSPWFQGKFDLWLQFYCWTEALAHWKSPELWERGGAVIHLCLGSSKV